MVLIPHYLASRNHQGVKCAADNGLVGIDEMLLIPHSLASRNHERVKCAADSGLAGNDFRVLGYGRFLWACCIEEEDIY